MKNEKNLNQIVAENLINLRKNSGLTQQELAKELNYSDKTVSKWEKGYMVPSVDILLQLAKFYGVNLDYFTTLEHPNILYKNKVDKNKTNKIVILAMAVTAVWFIAISTLTFIYMRDKAMHYEIIGWGTFASALVASFFTYRFWGRNIGFIVLLSISIWALIGAALLQVYVSQSEFAWPIFFIGLPIQVAIILWKFMK